MGVLIIECAAMIGQEFWADILLATPLKQLNERLRRPLAAKNGGWRTITDDHRFIQAVKMSRMEGKLHFNVMAVVPLQVSKDMITVSVTRSTVVADVLTIGEPVFMPDRKLTIILRAYFPGFAGQNI
jgi:hypothetical protein